MTAGTRPQHVVGPYQGHKIPGRPRTVDKLGGWVAPPAAGISFPIPRHGRGENAHSGAKGSRKDYLLIGGLRVEPILEEGPGELPSRRGGSIQHNSPQSKFASTGPERERSFAQQSGLRLTGRSGGGVDGRCSIKKGQGCASEGCARMAGKVNYILCWTCPGAGDTDLKAVPSRRAVSLKGSNCLAGPNTGASERKTGVRAGAPKGYAPTCRGVSQSQGARAQQGGPCPDGKQKPRQVPGAGSTCVKRFRPPNITGRPLTASTP